MATDKNPERRYVGHGLLFPVPLTTTWMESEWHRIYHVKVFHAINNGVFFLMLYHFGQLIGLALYWGFNSLSAYFQAD